MVNINNFSQEKDCLYKDDKYAVRDNGAVLRYPRDNQRVRTSDNQWTFGKPNEKTGYMEIAGERVHRIVATAFYGEPPTKEHVVDHIDTNKKNNRFDNLRWVTRLENVLLNPITVKRIEIVCGSVEAFLENPSKFRDKFQESNYAWMCTVNADEAKVSLERLLKWAASDKKTSSRTIGEWIFARNSPEPLKTVIQDTPSLTDGAVQRKWRTPTEFHCCPKLPCDNPIEQYSANLKHCIVFSSNTYGEQKVYESAANENALLIITENLSESSMKPFALVKIFFENGQFVHESIGTFFTDEGAQKEFILAQGLEWKDGDTFDDLC